MSRTFYMPTRIEHGTEVLSKAGLRAQEMDLRHVLVVTDPVITAQPFFATFIEGFAKSDVRVSLFDECGIDARLAHVDGQTARVLREGIDGIVGIGGGSAMCTAKAIAMAVPNGGFSNCVGPDAKMRRAMTMIMVPTTAGSGAEVSQFTLVRDDLNSAKFVAGGPQSFPDLALLDPVVLADIPPRLGVISAVDALVHAFEAMFTSLATPLTDGLALTAITEITTLLRADKATPEQRERALVAASVANMACGNARLGLAHAASLPLEAHCSVLHGVGVGVLLPRVLQFNAPSAPEKVALIADRLGLPCDADQIAQWLLQIYAEIEFPTHFDDSSLIEGYEDSLAKLALPGLYGGPVQKDDDGIAWVNSPNIRRANAADVAALYRSCLR